MTLFRKRQIFGWSVLALCALLGCAWIARLDFARKISTDVLDLIPSKERAPELALVRELAGQAEARVMFFVLTTTKGEPASPEAGDFFAGQLRQSESFSEARPLAEFSSQEAIGRELFAQRFTLLFPQWLEERAAAFAQTQQNHEQFSTWLAADTASSLSRFLVKPEALAFQDSVSDDPLLLLPAMLEKIKGRLGIILPSETPSRPSTLIWAKIAFSPMTEKGQTPVFLAIARAIEATNQKFPGTIEKDTGVNRFAAASRKRIEHEVSWLNLLSLAAVLCVAAIFIRKLYRGLHLLPVIAFSILGAWVAATMVFERIHVLVFVVGSLLTGVAIDYGFYLYMQPPAKPGEDYWRKVRRLLKPLLASCFTTAAGFALLTRSELPLIRQLGVFVGSGLICALLSAILYFSTVKNPFLETRSFRGGQALTVRSRRRLRRALLLVWLTTLPGLFFLSWRDDIRELETPDTYLAREDARIRDLFGDGSERTVYLTQGATVNEARASLEKFDRWLSSNLEGKNNSINLGVIIPTLAQHHAALKFLRESPDFPDQLRKSLETAGFELETFTPFFDEYAKQVAHANEGDLDKAILSLSAHIGGPMALLLHAGSSVSWFVTLAAHAPANSPPPETHTIAASQLQSLNQIFSRYRVSALRLSLIGLAIVGAGVFLTYGLRDGLRIFAIPCGACLGIFGLFGWAGQPLNMFHLLGAFLGVCLTHNYSIFSVTSAYRSEPLPASVRLSALTAAASFGVLALSGIPVVHAMGVTVTTMVLAALLIIELEHFAPISKENELRASR